MLEMGRIDEKVLIGLGLALVVHIAILSSPLNLSSRPLQYDTQITLSLQSKPDILQPEPGNQQAEASEQKPVVAAPIKRAPDVERELDLKANREPNPEAETEIISVRPTKDAAQTRLAVSPYSSHFKRFLQSESEIDKAKGSPQQGKFAESFGPKFPTVNKPKDMTYAQGPLGGGNYKVIQNGKVRCQLQMVPLTIDDQNYAFPPTSKDCSPPDKFDLNLNQPVDGNMDTRR